MSKYAETVTAEIASLKKYVLDIGSKVDSMFSAMGRQSTPTSSSPQTSDVECSIKQDGGNSRYISVS